MNAIISNLINDNGNATANQFVISDGSSVSFQSYSSLVVRVHGKQVTFGCDWDYSRTTLKYVRQFLKGLGLTFGSTDAIRKAITTGQAFGYEISYDANMR